MKCQNEIVCDGELDLGNCIGTQINHGCVQNVYVCVKCGRLHSLNGKQSSPSLIYSRRGFRAFLEGDAIVSRDENGAEQHRWQLS